MLDLKADGWVELEDDGFIAYVGPFYCRKDAEGVMEFAMLTQAKHRNTRGVAQGGVVMTFADRIMGVVALRAARPNLLATAQMDTQFVDSIRLGELLYARPRIVRATKSLIFMTTDVAIDGRCVAHASAVFKVSRKHK